MFTDNSDPESGLSPQNPNNPFSVKRIRAKFIQKVYGILSFQLAFTFAVCGICLFSDDISVYLLSNGWVLWVALGFQVATSMTLFCCQSVARAYPWNYILLGLCTLATSILLSVICASYTVYAIFIAAGLTLACTLAISIFSCFTSIDFTKCMHILFIVGIVVTVASVVLIFWHNHIAQIIYAVIGTLLMMAYLAVHTQMIVGGRRYELSPEDYIFGALTLYMDIINMFLYILQLVGQMENR